MEDKNKIKRIALEKLDELVKKELKYLIDTNDTIDSFSLDANLLKNTLTKEEYKEVFSCISKQLMNGNVHIYCWYRFIDIPDQLIKK